MSHMRTRPSSEELAKTLSLTGLTDRPYTASSCKKTLSVSPRSTSCRITCSSFPAATDRNIRHLISPLFQLQHHKPEQLLVLPPEKTRLLVLSNARQKMLDRCSPFNLIGLARVCIAFSMSHSSTLRSSPPTTQDINRFTREILQHRTPEGMNVRLYAHNLAGLQTLKKSLGALFSTEVQKFMVGITKR